MKKKRSFLKKILEAKVFGFILGLTVFLIMAGIQFNPFVKPLKFLDQKLTDIYFLYRDVIIPQHQGEGVTVRARNPQVSPDILILGIDNKSLELLGKWPFPRYVYADLARNLARIKDQTQRENSILYDILFIEPDRDAVADAVMKNGFSENKRIFLETMLEKVVINPENMEDYQQRHKTLFEKAGEVTNVTGPWETMNGFPGLLPPLRPFAEEAAGYGHAIFMEDADEVFRRQPLLVKSMEMLEEIIFENLIPDQSGYEKEFIRYTWQNKNGEIKTIPSPLTAQVINDLKLTLEQEGIKKFEDADGDGVLDTSNFIIRKYRDHFIPSITLSLALSYFHKSLDNPKDLEVVIGSHIKINNPMVMDVNTGNLTPYTQILVEAQFDAEGNVITPAKLKTINEITIPIDDQAQMTINYIGKRSSENADEYQTFTVRPFSSYATRMTSDDPTTWAKTLKLENKIILVGAFSVGIADDEKPTPMGLMFGVEIHANALNTIIKQKFITSLSMEFNLLLMTALMIFIVLMATRAPTILAFFTTIVSIFLYFFCVLIVFDYLYIDIPFTSTALGMLITFISIVIYRVMTEEKSKLKLQTTFGKFVHPAVVNQMIENPPELGGVDRELTVLFSDIRGFTTLSESMSPQELVNHLNIYLTAMTDVIIEYRGTLDKYVGDEIMCFWGAPLDQKEHAILAAKCALKQMEVLGKLNSQWPVNRRFDIGVGLNSGIMTVGMMGSSGRMNYTLMGDNVNLGARLEGTNKQYQTHVIISEYTYALIKETAIVRELDNIRVKGKNRPVLIYELLDFTDGIEPPAKIKNSNEK